MQRSQRLQLVLDLERRKEDEEAKKLGRLQQMLQQEMAKAEELLKYQGEYQDALRAGQISDPNRMQVYHQFIARLSQAFEQQQLHVEKVRGALANQQARWAEIHGRRRNIESYIGKCRDEEAQLAEKKLQRQLDDAQGRRRYTQD